MSAYNNEPLHDIAIGDVYGIEVSNDDVYIGIVKHVNPEGIELDLASHYEGFVPIMVRSCSILRSHIKRYYQWN
ncbi:hypothetical protein D3C74_498640 [compost metagenome]